MPSVNVYLNEEEYVKLAHLAMKRGIRTSLLARHAVQKLLKEEQPGE